MIQLFNLFFMDKLIPKTLGELTTAHWVLIGITIFLVLMILIKMWQKIMTLVIKLLLIACVVLIIYIWFFNK